MEQRIKALLMTVGLLLPAAVKALLIEVGSELDRLRAEVAELRSKIEGK